MLQLLELERNVMQPLELERNVLLEVLVVLKQLGIEQNMKQL
ncbi:hypothetical protein N9917_01980 [Deltaproteobacteria bacterium]|nr:hypothetical protein [Deltaproteobacteria bacterium]